MIREDDGQLYLEHDSGGSASWLVRDPITLEEAAEIIESPEDHDRAWRGIAKRQRAAEHAAQRPSR